MSLISPAVYTSIKAGAATALGTMIIQAAAPASAEPSIGSLFGEMPMLLPVISAAVGAAMSYGILHTTVKRMETDMQDLKREVGNIYTLVRESMTEIAHIQGRLDVRHESRDPNAQH